MKTQKTYKSFFSIKQVLVLLFVTMFANTLFAQNATLSGTVKDDVEGVFGVIIQIKGTSKGAQTDFDGFYMIDNVPLGKQKVIFNNMGISDTVDVIIKAGNNTLDHVFGEGAIALGEVVIDRTKFIKDDAQGKESVLQEQQLNAEQQVENIGTEELSKQGVGDVGEGVAKIAGVSKSAGSGSVFVRGLGDRYNNAFLNGMPVASPNPDLKVIPLDIFPTSIVKYISVSKVFDEKYYADYAGASIDIQTKTYTDTTGFFEVGLSGKVNTITSFQDFYTQKDGKIEFLGIDGGNRDIPSEITSYKNDKFVSTTTSPYKNGLNPTLMKALPGVGISLSGGKFFAFRDSTGRKNTDKGFGFLLSISTGNQYNTVRNGIERQYSAQSTILTDFGYNKYSFTASSSIIGSFIYKINAKNNISYNVLYVSDADNTVRENQGYSQDLGVDIYSRRNSFIINNLLNHQLLGSHEAKKYDVEWGTSFGTAGSEEKERKDLVYFVDPAGYFFNSLNVAGNNRLWSALQEKDYAVKGDVKYHLFRKDSLGVANDSIRGNIKIGANYRHKDREFDYKQVNYSINDVNSLQNGNQYVDDIYNPDAYLNAENLASGAYFLKEQQDQTSFYQARLDVTALYAGLDYDITKKFKVLGGLRLEKSTQVVEYKKLSNTFASKPLEVSIDTINVFPSLGFKYSPKDKTNIRFATSQTITRPGFKEIAPFLYQSYFGGPTSQGNPDLKNAYNYNADLKYEVSPNKGELMSVTVFGRYLDNPIERIAIASSSTLLSYQNIQAAYVAGIEFEVSKNLATLLYPNKNQDSLVSWTKNVSGGANFSYMKSQINIPQDSNLIITNFKRPLQGASPYLINFDATYELKLGKDSLGEYKSTTTFTLTYNVFGKRVYAAGVQKAEDIYEMPVNTLDFIVKSKINKRLSVGLKATNILNPTIRLQQKKATENSQLTVQSYKRGVTVSLGIDYKF